jgi:glycine/D-amino acid oxidase-like deaminating enzyme
MQYGLVVVGGGIVGTTVAYLACKARPEWPVLIAERRDVGGGASQFSAGFDAIEDPSCELRDLAIRGRLRYRAMSRDVPEAAVRPVLTHWVVDEERARTFPANFRTQTADFSSIDIVDDAALGAFRIPRRRRIVRDTQNGFARPGAVCRGIVRHLREHHERFACWEGVEVVAVRPQDDRCVVELRDGRELQTAHVVVAAGPWFLQPATAALVPERFALRVKKVASLRIERDPGPGASAVVFYEEGAFFLPVADERCWLFNFTLDSWDGDPDTSTALDREELRAGAQVLRELAPDLAAFVGGAYAFCDLYAAGRIPVVAAAPASARITVAGACSGAGFRIAPALAEDALARVLAS